MNRLKLSAILLVALIPGCGGGSEMAAVYSGTASNTAANSASTLYSAEDRASTAQFEVMNSNATANSTVASRTIRAKQSGRTVQNVVQKTTLAQARVAQEAPVTVERKVIRNADLQLETAEPEESQQKIVSIAEQKGGYVVESQQSTSDLQTKKRDTVVMTVRVPADRFESALGEIRDTAQVVISETVKGEDVTEEFIDVEARIKTQKALEQQYMEIMKRANSVEDALYVQSELASVRGEIEKVEGRKRYLENQSSLSTIKVKLQTPAAFTASTGTFSNQFNDSVGSGLDFAIKFVLGFLAFLVGALPIVLVFGLPGFFVGRYLWKRQSKPMTVTEIAKEEVKIDY